MTNWYKDIFPCDSCVHQGLFKKRCRKKHTVTHVDKMMDMGTMVNTGWYFFDEECPDFLHIESHDPSGS